MSKETKLTVEQLNLSAGSFKISDVSLRITQGKFHALVGPTGSGKTLLLESIAGLRNIDSGKIVLSDRDITDVPTELRNIAYLPQDLCLFPNMSVEQNINYSLRVKKRSNELTHEYMVSLKKTLQIDHLLNRKVINLSGGEKQRVAMARALAAQNTLVLLDEPFSSLNLHLRKELWLLLKKLQHKHNLSFLIVTHSLEEALFLSEEVSLVYDGKIIQSGTKHEVFNCPLNIKAARILGYDNFFEVSHIKTTDDYYTFYADCLKAELKVNKAMNKHLHKVESEKILLGIRAARIEICETKNEENMVFSIDQIHDKIDGYSLKLSHDETGFSINLDVPENLQKMLEAKVGDKMFIMFPENRLVPLTD